jgi:hypothetical protein
MENVCLKGIVVCVIGEIHNRVVFYIISYLIIVACLFDRHKNQS